MIGSLYVRIICRLNIRYYFQRLFLVRRLKPHEDERAGKHSSDWNIDQDTYVRQEIGSTLPYIHTDCGQDAVQLTT